MVAECRVEGWNGRGVLRAQGEVGTDGLDGAASIVAEAKVGAFDHADGRARGDELVKEVERGEFEQVRRDGHAADFINPGGAEQFLSMSKSGQYLGRGCRVENGCRTWVKNERDDLSVARCGDIAGTCDERLVPRVNAVEPADGDDAGWQSKALAKDGVGVGWVRKACGREP